MTPDTPPNDSTTTSQAAALWTTRARSGRGVAAIREAGLELTALGGDADPPAELDINRYTDLRAMLAAAGQEVVLVDEPAAFAGLTDPRTVWDLTQRGGRLFCADCPFSSIDGLASGWLREVHGARPIDRVRLLGTPRATRGWAEAAALLESFGEITHAAVIVAGEGVLRGELGLVCDAADLLLGVLGEIEAVHAIRLEREAGSGSVASVRAVSGAIGSVSVARGASPLPAWSLTAYGPAGSLQAAPAAVLWRDPAGALVDASEAAAPRDAVTDEFLRACDPTQPALPPVDLAAVLCVAEAARLSDRTGQPESPETIRRAVT